MQGKDKRISTKIRKVNVVAQWSLRFQVPLVLNNRHSPITDNLADAIASLEAKVTSPEWCGWAFFRISLYLFSSACTSQSSSDWISTSLLYQATSVIGTASLRMQLNVAFSPRGTSTSVRGCKICRRHSADKNRWSSPQLEKQIKARDFVNIYAEALDSQALKTNVSFKERLYRYH